MTQEEWLGNDPRSMFALLAGEDGRGNSVRAPIVSNRKFWLFACACCLTSNPRSSLRDVDDYETHGMRTQSDLIWAHGWAFARREAERPPLAVRASLLRDVAGNPFLPAIIHNAGSLCAFAGRREVLAEKKGHRRRRVGAPTEVLIEETFRPVATLTETITHLATAAYEDRLQDGRLDPGRLAVLADSLEEAGCREPRILDHLRGREACPSHDVAGKCDLCKDSGVIELRSPHYRGCWAVDLILDKE